ncbi:TRAP-type C4-dicarboxylate transport system permease small subunit [Caldalkalibacillus uzonensis]|uniref:TRAP-type C4-dicarboxylate transport system permease small subunit n=1 Tax=Caldalkalibacillus uzonensis TaxID=353224 RepID=A0ABU0CPF5_9BACI|nr:TRAP transporter small permease [Caldalkalibacillus uzonensis]MDQ0338285.1 TRAP-type C4-dicarboxylate transport system permease small subunit [Caldalkalibacillus uzonensis]
MKVLRWLDEHLEEYMLILLSVIAVVIVFYQVFMRYVMGDSSRWSEELARYLFIWLIYIGISYGVKRQRHISVDALSMVLSARGKVILNIIANMLFLFFAVFMVFYGYQVMMYIFDRGQTSAGLGLPMGYVYAAGPVGMALTSVRLIQHLIKQFRRLLAGDLEDVEEEFEEQIKQS